MWGRSENAERHGTRAGPLGDCDRALLTGVPLTVKMVPHMVGRPLGFLDGILMSSRPVNTTT